MDPGLSVPNHQSYSYFICTKYTSLFCTSYLYDHCFCRKFQWGANHLCELWWQIIRIKNIDWTWSLNVTDWKTTEWRMTCVTETVFCLVIFEVRWLFCIHSSRSNYISNWLRSSGMQTRLAARCSVSQDTFYALLYYGTCLKNIHFNKCFKIFICQYFKTFLWKQNNRRLTRGMMVWTKFRDISQYSEPSFTLRSAGGAGGRGAGWGRTSRHPWDSALSPSPAASPRWLSSPGWSRYCA